MPNFLRSGFHTKVHFVNFFFSYLLLFFEIVIASLLCKKSSFSLL